MLFLGVAKQWEKNAIFTLGKFDRMVGIIGIESIEGILGQKDNPKG